jgi:bacteriocin-like protein
VAALLALDAGKDGEMIMSNSSNNELTISREITADELNQVTGGWGPMFLSRIASSPTAKSDIPGESIDNLHKERSYI